MIERLGKYQIVEQIGRGGMGAVYTARDPLLKRVVALKVISENVDESDELRARFFREAKACAQLSHPNIITIYDLGEDGGRLFIVMEYLEGEDLRQVISQRRDLALENKLALMVQIYDGLSYAHQKGIVHRDIKPGNVFVSHNGVAKVLDFGVARITSAKENLTHTARLMGTLRYMSPEQARGQVDPRSDMFSAAAMFYELIAYHPPLSFDQPMAILEDLRSATEPSRFRPDEAIPEDLGAVIERALRKDPEERFRNMLEMRAALEEVRARLARQAAALRQRLDAQAKEARALHARLVELVGGDVAQEVLPVPVDRAPVAVLEAVCHEGENIVARLRLKVEHADRLRPKYEQAMDHMRLGQWGAAESAFEQLAREMPEHVAVKVGLAHAGAEALRAAEVERQRQEAGHAQALVDEARKRAAPTAAQDEDGAWSAAEVIREAGLSALVEKDYASARERFEAAAEQYRAAAEAGDRRIKELLEAARRGIEAHDFDECLALAGKVLALVPDELEARALILEAKRGVARRAMLAAGYDAARETLASGDLHGAIDALTRLVEEEPDYALAHQLLRDARAMVAEEERARRLLEEAPERKIAASPLEKEPEAPDATGFDRTLPFEPALPQVLELPEPAQGVEARSTDAASATVVTTARRGAEPARPRRLRGRALALAAGGALVVVCVIWLAVSLVSQRRLQGEVDQWRNQLSAARQEAVKVEADKLAQELFSAADIKAREGQQQARDGRLAAAVPTMRAATALYEDAGRTARGMGVERTKADQARDLMLAAKRRAVTDAPSFNEGLALESEGNQKYNDRAFRDAAEHFGAATQRFAVVVVTPSAQLPEPSVRRDAATEIREALDQYMRVFKTKDLDLLRQIRPGIRPEEVSRYRDIFDQTRSYKLVLRAEAIKVSGNEAEARGRREDVVVTSHGETLRTPGEFRFRLKRVNDRWTIDAVR